MNPQLNIMVANGLFAFLLFGFIKFKDITFDTIKRSDNLIYFIADVKASV